MKKLNRRNFLQLAGASSAVATAGLGIVASSFLGGSSAGKTVMFRAVAGMPTRPLPSYASYVLEGHVDLARRSGVITKTVLAGSPQMMSSVALPGMSRIAHITDVETIGDTLRITGMVDDRSQLMRGESPFFTVLIDHANGTARTQFFGNEVALLLVQ
jgi:hypothetical protein